MFDLILTGGRVVDGSGTPWFHADIGIRGDRIAAAGALGRAEARQRVDVAGLVVAPGFVDMHVHADLALLADPLHEAAVRQGVTTYLLGQDGVAMAPASPKTLAYMRRYTAGFSGRFEVEARWSSMAEYLACFDRRVAVNVACLVPNGNVRMEVLGLETRAATTDELRRMRAIVRQAMEEGAVGLSSGLDYIPSRYADTASSTSPPSPPAAWALWTAVSSAPAWSPTSSSSTPPRSPTAPPTTTAANPPPGSPTSW